MARWKVLAGVALRFAGSNHVTNRKQVISNKLDIKVVSANGSANKFANSLAKQAVKRSFDLMAIIM